MGGTPWATPNQLAYLDSMLPSHAAAQKEKTLRTFWTTLFKGFFEKWPNQDAEMAEDISPVPEGKSRRKKVRARVPETFEDEKAWIKDRKEKMNTYMNNHRLTSNSRTGGGSKISISVNPSRKKVSSLVQIYTRMFYETHLKEHVEPRLQGVSEKSILATKNQIISELWKKESESRKNEVEREQAKERQAIEEERKMEDSVDDLVRTPEEYLAGITSLRNMAEGFFKKMERRSGWSFTLIAGGPDPREGGELTTFALHSSQNKFGLSFGKAHPNFEEHFLPPFVAFLEQVYGPEVRKQRALKTENDQDVYPSTLPVNGQQTDQLSLPTSVKGHTEVPATGVAPLNIPTTPAPLRRSPAPATAVTVTSYPMTVTEPTCMGAIQTVSTNAVQPMTIGLPQPITVPDIPGVTSLVPSTQSAASHPAAKSVPMPLLLGTALPTLQEDATACTSTVTSLYCNGGFGDNIFHEGQASFSNTMEAAGSANQLGYSGGWNSNWETLTAGINWTDPDLFTMDRSSSSMIPPSSSSQSDHMLEGTNSKPSGFDTIYNLGGMPFINTGNLAEESLSTSYQSNNTITTCPELSSACGVPSNLPLQSAVPDERNSPNSSSLQSPAVPESTHSSATKENTPLPQSTVTIASTRQRKPIGPKEVIPLVQQKAAAPSDWFGKAEEHLSMGSTTPAWQECLRLWSLLETQSGLLNTLSHRLPGSKERPEVLSQWLLTSRDYNDVPCIGDPTDFGDKWVTWWNKMQPPWRRVDEKNAMPSPLTPENGSLSSLKRCGPAGLVTVLIGLKWWGSTGKDDKRWLAAVDDVTACLKVLTESSGAGGTKRKAPRAEETGRVGKKRKP